MNASFCSIVILTMFTLLSGARGDCVDLDWVDVDGNDCSIYENVSGDPCYVAAYFAVNGTDATVACCVCGGGIHTCTVIEVRNRVGFNEDINGLYFQTDEEEGGRHYFFDEDKIYIYFLEDVDIWVIGRHLGSTTAYAYGVGDVETPDLVTTGWKLFGPDGWIPDDEMIVECGEPPETPTQEESPTTRMPGSSHSPTSPTYWGCYNHLSALPLNLNGDFLNAEEITVRSLENCFSICERRGSSCIGLTDSSCPATGQGNHLTADCHCGFQGIPEIKLPDTECANCDGSFNGIQCGECGWKISIYGDCGDPNDEATQSPDHLNHTSSTDTSVSHCEAVQISGSQSFHTYINSVYPSNDGELNDGRPFYGPTNDSGFFIYFNAFHDKWHICDTLGSNSSIAFAEENGFNIPYKGELVWFVADNDGGWVEDSQINVQCYTPDGCGDGIPQRPEQCDDGNFNNDDGCRNDCTVSFCGDGIVDFGEECDNGNHTEDESCKLNCEFTCGDGIQEFGELCDAGEETLTTGEELLDACPTNNVCFRLGGECLYADCIKGDFTCNVKISGSPPFLQDINDVYNSTESMNNGHPSYGPSDENGLYIFYNSDFDMWYISDILGSDVRIAFASANGEFTPYQGELDWFVWAENLDLHVVGGDVQASCILFEEDRTERYCICGYSSPDADQCPSDPRKIRFGICGCGVADTDNDRDGHVDCLEPEACRGNAAVFEEPCVPSDCGDCTEARDSPGCGVQEVELCVCLIDPICCNMFFVWDAECVNVAKFNCGCM